MELTSPSFEPMGPIPVQYTSDGANISPPLYWRDAPAGTKSFALIVEDPDAPDPRAPERTFVHWAVYNLPPDGSSLREGAARVGLPDGAMSGLNDWKHGTYDGPAPPVGRHRYFFKLYALDTRLNVASGKQTRTKAEIDRDMRDHVLAHAELVGTYARPAQAAPRPSEKGANMFKRIVLATDFGESSRKASDLARRLVSNVDATIFLVHTYELPMGPVGDAMGVIPAPAIDLQAVWGPVEQAARENLDAEVARFGGAGHVEPILRSGAPWEEVLLVAKEKNADLIVVGSHGRSGLTRTLLGSVAEKIARTAPIPVLLVRETNE